MRKEKEKEKEDQPRLGLFMEQTNYPRFHPKLGEYEDHKVRVRISNTEKTWLMFRQDSSYQSKGLAIQPQIIQLVERNDDKTFTINLRCWNRGHAEDDQDAVLLSFEMRNSGYNKDKFVGGNESFIILLYGQDLGVDGRRRSRSQSRRSSVTPSSGRSSSEPTIECGRCHDNEEELKALRNDNKNLEDKVKQVEKQNKVLDDDNKKLRKALEKIHRESDVATKK